MPSNITDQNSWNFKTKHVQQDAQLFGGFNGENFISSESIAICAVKSPATGTSIGTADLFPIGVVQSAGVQQQKQINQIYEIGSRLSYFIPGRTMLQIQLSRVVFNGENLLAVLYDPDDTQTDANTELSPGLTGAGAKFYVNLASELFNKPIDLALVFYDSEREPLGAVILKDCMVQSHGFGVSANQTVIAENVLLRASTIETLSIA